LIKVFLNQDSPDCEGENLLAIYLSFTGYIFAGKLRLWSSM